MFCVRTGSEVKRGIQHLPTSCRSICQKFCCEPSSAEEEKDGNDMKVQYDVVGGRRILESRARPRNLIVGGRCRAGTIFERSFGVHPEKVAYAEALSIFFPSQDLDAPDIGSVIRSNARAEHSNDVSGGSFVKRKKKIERKKKNSKKRICLAQADVFNCLRLAIFTFSLYSTKAEECLLFEMTPDTCAAPQRIF